MKIHLYLPSLLIAFGFFGLTAPNPWHAQCQINWGFQLNCTTVNVRLITQAKAWAGKEGCAQGGEKCLYAIQESAVDHIKMTHTTPVHHYVDDLTFGFTVTGNSSCAVKGYSRSETWYAVLDSGTNYCNLHNLITGSGLDKAPGYKEATSDSVCTQYSKRNCDKY